VAEVEVRSRHIEVETVIVTKDGTTGWSTVATLPRLRAQGRILHVVTRQDGTLDDATDGIVVISPAPLTSTPTDNEVVFESDAITFVGHATTASDIDNVANIGGAAYSVDNDTPLNIAVNVTATAGGTTSLFELTVTAEVYR
jgi:hypothetical protein